MKQEPTYHPEELEKADKENRPVMIHRLFRYDHLQHNIPLGSLVEVEIKINDDNTSGSIVDLKGNCKLFVVGHMKDCDGTPLYILSDIPVFYPKHLPMFDQEKLIYRCVSIIVKTGYAEERLKPTGKEVDLFRSIKDFIKN